VAGKELLSEHVVEWLKNRPKRGGVPTGGGSREWKVDGAGRGATIKFSRRDGFAWAPFGEATGARTKDRERRKERQGGCSDPDRKELHAQMKSLAGTRQRKGRPVYRSRNQ